MWELNPFRAPEPITENWGVWRENVTATGDEKNPRWSLGTQRKNQHAKKIESGVVFPRQFCIKKPPPRRSESKHSQKKGIPLSVQSRSRASGSEMGGGTFPYRA